MDSNFLRRGRSDVLLRRARERQQNEYRGCSERIADHFMLLATGEELAASRTSCSDNVRVAAV
jgi:hypothetical protein